MARKSLSSSRTAFLGTAVFDNKDRWGRPLLRTLGQQDKKLATWEVVFVPSACRVLSALRRPNGLLQTSDPASRLYSFPTSMDGRWAMIDTKPVWVPVPTVWQKVLYYVWKICSAVVGIAICGAVTYAIYTLPDPAKWLLTLVYPLAGWISYKMFIQGGYNTVQQWAELRAKCMAAPFSEAIRMPGVHECLTPLELRKKLLRESASKGCPIEFIATGVWDLAILQRAGLFSLKEIEDIAEYKRAFLDVDSKYRKEKSVIESAFSVKLKSAAEVRDRTISKARAEYYNSAELRLNREIENTFNNGVRALNLKKEAKLNKILNANIPAANKQAAMDKLEKRHKKKLDTLAEVRDVKLRANSASVTKKGKELEDRVKDANEVFEGLRKRLYIQEGMAQKYDNLEREFTRNKRALQDEWQRFVDSVLVQESVPDSIPPRY